MFASLFAGFFACAFLVACCVIAWIEKERRRHCSRASTWRNAYFQHVRASDRRVGSLQDEMDDLRNKLADALSAAGDTIQTVVNEEAS